MPKIIAITADTKPKRYVSNTVTRKEGSVVAELTDDPGYAQDFKTVEHATLVATKILNPWHRVFEAKQIEVEKRYKPENLQEEAFV